MTQNYICNISNKTDSRIVGRSAFSLNAKKCPNFQSGDIIYFSRPDHTIHSRWVVTGANEKIITITKNPEISMSISQKDILSEPYEDKYSKLSEIDAEALRKHFLHQIKILPSYNYRSKNSETNKVLQKLKELDLKLEVYPDAIYNNDILNERLEDPYSVIILDNYGVITFKCIENDPAKGDQLLKTKFQKQLICNDIHEMLSKSPQLSNDYSSKLMINHINVILYETTNVESIKQLNAELVNKHINTLVFDCNSFIEFIKHLPQNQKVIDEIKRVGIIQSLLPKFINSKTIDITSEPLKFIPNDTFELDDIQKETLKALDQRTHIKASAGSGKTILLLAKAYEVATANPGKNFLFLCINNKLAEDVTNQAINTGRNASNLRISTFDKFLMDENIPCGNNSLNFGQQCDARKTAFVELVLSNKLHYSFGGIFVDEVQQMKDEWLYALLQCVDEEKYMIVSGDYYQSINPSLIEDENEDEDDDFIEEDDSMEYKIGEYEFKTIVLDKNYRNTKSIAKALDKMVSLIHKTSQEIETPIKEEKVLGHAYKNSIALPRLIKTSHGPSEVQLVKGQVDALINKYHCAPSDILIVCPRRNSMTNMLERELGQKYAICNFTGNKYAKINAEGIKMGSIGKSIGLDFKAVILYGTNLILKDLKEPCDYIYDINDLKHQSKNTKKKFLSALRCLYVACSRARDILIVFNDFSSENLFTGFLEESGLEEEY